MKLSFNRGRRALGAAATVCIAVGAMVGMASAADAVRPVATATATVTYDSAQVDVSVARGVTQIRTATCTLDGSAVACGSPSANGKKAATYAVTLADLAAGSHTFVISIRLTDGGLATASASFVSTGPVSPRQAACEGAGGNLVDYFTQWECHWSLPPMSQDDIDPDPYWAAIQPVCARPPFQPVQILDVPETQGYDVYTTCNFETTFQARAACQAGNIDGFGSFMGQSDDVWDCVTDNPDVTLDERLDQLCVEAGGTLTTNEEPVGYRRLRCSAS